MLECFKHHRISLSAKSLADHTCIQSKEINVYLLIIRLLVSKDLLQEIWADSKYIRKKQLSSSVHLTEWVKRKRAEYSRLKSPRLLKKKKKTAVLTFIKAPPIFWCKRSSVYFSVARATLKNVNNLHYLWLQKHKNRGWASEVVRSLWFHLTWMTNDLTERSIQDF